MKTLIPPVFRKARPEDVKVIVDFQLAMAWETEKLKLNLETLTRGVNAVLTSPEIGEYYLCEVHGRVVGGLMITKEWSDWRNGAVWWIQSVYFLPEFRGQKLYSGLYKYIQKMVESDVSARGIRLYVDKSNITAQKVYAQLGMDGEHYQLFEWMK